jgi:hypothetical protein
LALPEGVNADRLAPSVLPGAGDIRIDCSARGLPIAIHHQNVAFGRSSG